MSDIGLPLPETYHPAPFVAKNKLDVREPPRVQDLVEDWTAAVLWALCGAVLALVYVMYVR